MLHKETFQFFQGDGAVDSAFGKVISESISDTLEIWAY